MTNKSDSDSAALLHPHIFTTSTFLVNCSLGVGFLFLSAATAAALKLKEWLAMMMLKLNGKRRRHVVA